VKENPKQTNYLKPNLFKHYAFNVILINSLHPFLSVKSFHKKKSYPKLVHISADS